MQKEQKSPGGLLVGETDKNGGPGIKVVAPEGNILMGGGELILTSDTGKSDVKHEFDGKKMTPCEIASELNQEGGGVKIPCHIAEPANTTDSKMQVGDVIKKEKGGSIGNENLTELQNALSKYGWTARISEDGKHYQIANRNGKIVSDVKFKGSRYFFYNMLGNKVLSGMGELGKSAERVATGYFYANPIGESETIKSGNMAFGGITEADESATSKRIAIENLKDQVRRDESMGVIDMYELAALKAGASVREVEQAAKEAKAERSNRKEVGTRIPSESNEDKLARLKRDLIRLQVVGEGDTHQAKVIKTKIQVLNKRIGNSMEKGGVAKDPYINLWNTYLKFVDGVDGIISEEGELPGSYFKDGVEDELNSITESTKTREDIIKNKDRIILNAKDLLDGVEGMTSTNRISEGRYFKKGAISAMNKLVRDSGISSMETGGKTSKGKFYKEVIDEDGTKWEVYSTSSSGKTNFDIYRNGEKQEYGAYKTTDIDPTIDQIRESEKRLKEFLEENKSNSSMEKGGKVEFYIGDRVITSSGRKGIIDGPTYKGRYLVKYENGNSGHWNAEDLSKDREKKYKIGEKIFFEFDRGALYGNKKFKGEGTIKNIDKDEEGNLFYTIQYELNGKIKHTHILPSQIINAMAFGGITKQEKDVLMKAKDIWMEKKNEAQAELRKNISAEDRRKYNDLLDQANQHLASFENGSMEKGGQVEEVEIFLPESKNRTYDHFSKNDEPKYRMEQKVFTSYNGPALNGTIDRIWLQDKDISRPAKSTDWGYKWMYSLSNLSRPVDVTAFYEDDLYPSLKDMEDKVRHYTATMDDDEDSMARGGKTQLQIGIEVEKEHKDLYERVKNMFEKNGMKMPISENEFYKTIAKAHLREDKYYYDKLLKYVEGDKKENGGIMPRPNNWQVYYMDNDRQKKVIEKNLFYHQAVKRSQEKQSEGLSSDYQPMSQ